MRGVLWGLALVAGCAADKRDAAPDDCGTGEPSRVQLIHKLSLARPDKHRVTAGFDLDDQVTGPGSGSGCGVEDFAGPGGATGVDSAFAYLLPALEQTEAQAIEEIIQANINNGELLLMLELRDLDDPVDDACVVLDVVRGAGVPDVGTDGFILSGQTFDRDPDAPGARMPEVAVTDGVAEGRDLELSLPVQIFDVSLDFELHSGGVSATLDDDGSAHGFFAGGVRIDDILEVTREENVDPALEGIVTSLLQLWSDLDPDAAGVCQQISITFEFEAVSAFLFEDAPEIF